MSYFSMRRAIGILGMSFPFILVFGSMLVGKSDAIQYSISTYYHTPMRDIFVGIICAIAVFLFSYRGYDWKDNLAGHLGCVFALGVAFLPCTNGNLQSPIVGDLHWISAAFFFSVLIFYSLYLFPKTHKGRPKSEQKKSRNKVFKICGYLMLACMLLVFIYMQFLEDQWPGLKKLNPVFWLESIILVLFGISWLTKGQLILKDVKGQ